MINAGGGAIDLSLVPYDLLTDREKKKNRERCQELLKYIQYQVLSHFNIRFFDFFNSGFKFGVNLEKVNFWFKLHLKQGFFLSS